MTVKQAVQEFESLLKSISSYETPFSSAIERFISAYEIDFEPPTSGRPAVQDISTSEVSREVREDGGQSR